MAAVFVSYAREDVAFVRRLTDALRARGRESWVDWEGIEPSDDWWASIVEAIEAADAFVFVLSPDSIASEACRRELDHATRARKRLIGVLHRDVEHVEVPPELSSVNWVLLGDDHDFEDGLAALDRALSLDLALIRVHTRVLTRAKAWELGDRRGVLLLRGDELRAGEEWLGRAAGGFEPQPTDLQVAFIATSSRAGRRRQRLVVGGSLAVASISIVLAVFAYVQRSQARHQAAISRSRELAARAEGELQASPENALGLAVGALRASRTGQAEHALSNALEASRLRIDLRQPGPVGSVAFSPVKGMLASGGSDGRVRLWHLATRRLVWTGGRGGSSPHVTFSARGDVLVASTDAAGDDDQDSCSASLRVLSAATGRLRRTLKIVPDIDDCTPFVSFVGATRTVAVADRSGAVRLLNVDTGREIRTLHSLHPPGGLYYTLAFRADGRALAAAGIDGAIRVIGLPGGTPIATIRRPERSHVNALDFSPDGTQLVIAESLGPTYVEDLRRHSVVATLQATFSSGVKPRWSPDGRLIAAASPHGEIYVWHVGSSRLVETLQSPTGQASLAVAFSADGMLATGAPDGSIRVWAPDPDLPVRRIGSVGRFEFAGYASSAHLGVFGNASEHVVVTDDGGREVRRLEPHGEGPFAVARDGNLAFWRDGTLYVQSARTGRVASARDAPAADPPELVALSDDGRVAAMAVAGGELTVFSPGSGGRTASFAVEEGGSPVTSLAVSSDGRLVAVASAGAVTIFRTRDLRVVREEPGSAVSFAPVGGLVAIVRPDVSIAVLRDDDWQEHAVIRGTPSGESYLAFSPDARLLATTGFDGVLRLWDTADGVLVRTRHLFEAPPVSDSTLATSPPVLTSAGFAMAGALLEGLAAYDVCDHCLDADALLAQARERLRDVRPSTGG